MGDPRKLRKKYLRPSHLWKVGRISEEKELCKKYGLKNKREIWKAKSKIRNFRKLARNLLALKGEIAEKQKNELLSKLRNLGIEIKTLEDVLGLETDDLLKRRLQSIVYKKGLVNSMKQARKYITHGHVLIQDKVVSIPSYLVLKDEEDKIHLKEKIKVIKVDRKEGKRQITEGEKK